MWVGTNYFHYENHEDYFHSESWTHTYLDLSPGPWSAVLGLGVGAWKNFPSDLCFLHLLIRTFVKIVIVISPKVCSLCLKGLACTEIGSLAVSLPLGALQHRIQACGLAYTRSLSWFLALVNMFTLGQLFQGSVSLSTNQGLRFYSLSKIEG